jgi:tetratricopeptide (TPR) repeat protein
MTTTPPRLTASWIALVLLSATAHASVWDRASTSPEDENAKELYDAKMLEGDTATLMSTVQSASIKNSLESIKRAEAAYRAAALARPREAEPYFRIGNLLYELHFGCDDLIARLPTCDAVYATPRRRDLVIDAWDEFERLAPLDPRVGEILLKRAILNTKAVNGSATDRKHLESTARDYQAALDRIDGLAGGRGDEQMLGNLAETYMMLDRLDDAIATYVRAIAVGAARVSTVYGLAVALDRDGSGDQAIRRIQAHGPEGFEAFSRDYQRRSVFFVPEGEADYYFGLLNEAFGNNSVALDHWNRYLASGAHPEFQPRAREHIAALRKLKVKPTLPPPSTPDEKVW